MIKRHAVKTALSVLVFLGACSVLLTPLDAGSDHVSARTLDELATQVRSPEELEKFMRKHFTYVDDRFLVDDAEYWQGPEEMLFHRKGDCEDYAVFAKAMLERMGYRVVLLALYWEDDAHTVTVFEKNGHWGIFDIDRLILSRAASLGGLADEVDQRWQSLGLMRKENHAGIISRKFLKNDHTLLLSSLFEIFSRSTRPVL